MKKIFSTLGLAAALFFVSCNKDKDDTVAPDVPDQKKLLTTTLDENWNFIYNADKTVKEMNINSGGTDYRQLFTYSTNKVGYSILSTGKKVIEGYFTLVAGKPTSYKWSYLDDMGNPTANFEETYEYNVKGLLQRVNWAGGSHTEYSYDLDGNMIQLINYNTLGEPGEKVEYSYGTQKDLYPQYGQLNSFTGGFLFPAFSKYLPVGKKITDIGTGIVSSQGTFTYDLDAEGYVIKGYWNKISGPYESYSWTNSFQ